MTRAQAAETSWRDAECALRAARDSLDERGKESDAEANRLKSEVWLVITDL